jgi:hypothetical protein
MNGSKDARAQHIPRTHDAPNLLQRGGVRFFWRASMAPGGVARLLFTAMLNRISEKPNAHNTFHAVDNRETD